MKTVKNIISGKTLHEMEWLHGESAKKWFFRRHTGRTYGAAMHVIGVAMCNPGARLNFSSLDPSVQYAKTHGHRTVIVRELKRAIEYVISSMKLIGFKVEDNHITYNPFVEVDVEVV